MSANGLTDYDRESARRVSHGLREQGWAKEFRVYDLMDRWRRLVEEVETGYEMTIDDYANELCVRRWLLLARPMLTQRRQEIMDSRLLPLDAR
jgi:hypothetical protein